MNLKLEILLESIISKYESLSLDNAKDRHTLVSALAKELAHLVQHRTASSREIFSEPDTLYCIFGDQDD